MSRTMSGGTSSHSPAQGRISPGEALVYFVLAVAVDLVMGSPLLAPVLDGAVLDPDGYMRLVRLQASLAQHAPVHVVARDASGDGNVLPWSHLFDAVILILRAPLRLFLSGEAALRWAGVATGPLSVGLLGAALAWAAAPLTLRGWRWTAPVLAASSFFVLSYGAAGMIHHHIPVAFTIVMTIGWAGRSIAGAPRAGCWMGLWAGLGIWLTPEAMPFVLAAFGGMGLAWLEGATASGFRQAAVAFLAVIAAAFVLDPPFAGYGAAEIDRISVVYLVLALAVLGVARLLGAIERRGWSATRRGLLGAAAALAGIAVWLALFPAVARGPAGLMTDAEAQAFFSLIAEMRPIVTCGQAWAFLLDGMLGLAAVVALAVAIRSLLWGYVALVAALVLLLGSEHTRFLTYAAVLGAALLPVILTWCERVLHPLSPGLRSLTRAAVLALFLVGPWSTSPLPPAAAAAASAGAPSPSCSVRDLGYFLAPYRGQVVLSDVNDVPELLYRTDILTVGSFYHRNIAGYMRLYAAWRSGPSPQLPEAVRATRAALLLFCPAADRPGVVADLPPDTLWDRLNRGEVPDWLALIAQNPGSGHRLFRIAVPRG